MITREQLQAVTLKSVNFGGIDNNLFQIHEGGDVEQTLALAVDFNLALTTLCGLLDARTNEDGDPVTCAELRALAHISSTASALVNSVFYGLRSEIGREDQV